MSLPAPSPPCQDAEAGGDQPPGKDLARALALHPPYLFLEGLLAGCKQRSERLRLSCRLLWSGSSQRKELSR